VQSLALQSAIKIKHGWAIPELNGGLNRKFIYTWAFSIAMFDFQNGRRERERDIYIYKPMYTYIYIIFYIYVRVYVPASHVKHAMEITCSCCDK
jgi:hypothetical protein